MPNIISNESRKRIVDGAIKSAVVRKNNALNQYNDNKKFCNNCKKELPYKKRNNKYCNRTCAASVTNRKYPKRKSNKTCLMCNIEIRGSNIYCSSICHKSHKWKVSEQEIERGVQRSPRIMKKYLINKFGYKCWSCNLDKWLDKPITLEIEHVDGNSGNNNLSNLKILCPNCHSFTDTYKAKNKGNGNKKRMDRYRSEKTINKPV